MRGTLADTNGYLCSFPPTTDEHKKQLNDFFTEFDPVNVVSPKVPGYVKAVKESNPNITSFGVVGVSSQHSFTLPCFGDGTQC